MKKFLIISAILLTSLSVYAATKTQEDYKQDLLDKGYLFGCTPANWSLIEPLRGGFNYAVQSGRVDIMELEVKAGLNPVSCGNSVVNMAIFFKKNNSLEFLLKNGFNANTQHLDHSFLTFAIYRKNPEAVRILLYNGADPNLNHGKKNPLNSAIKKKQPEIIKMLLDSGAKPNDKTFELIEKTKNQEIKDLFKQ